MKKLFTTVLLLAAALGYSQSNNASVFKSESYTIDGVPYLEPETILTLSDSEIHVKPLGTLTLIKKAIAVRNTSVYHCEYQGKPVEVITFISTDKLKVTVRGENLKHVIESDLIDPNRVEEAFSKTPVSARP